MQGVKRWPFVGDAKLNVVSSVDFSLTLRSQPPKFTTIQMQIIGLRFASVSLNMSIGCLELCLCPQGSLMQNCFHFITDFFFNPLPCFV